MKKKKRKKKIAEQSYLPTNNLLLKLVDKLEGKFKVAFSITGLALEQFALYSPEVIKSFQKLAKTGCVEFLAETYSHSLASLKDKAIFEKQGWLHTFNPGYDEQIHINPYHSEELSIQSQWFLNLLPNLALAVSRTVNDWIDIRFKILKVQRVK